MPDVMEMSGRDRRLMRKAVDEFVARRKERESRQRAIDALYRAYFQEWSDANAD